MLSPHSQGVKGSDPFSVSISMSYVFCTWLQSSPVGGPVMMIEVTIFPECVVRSGVVLTGLFN